jgi:hypothetical protein
VKLQRPQPVVLLLVVAVAAEAAVGRKPSL